MAAVLACGDGAVLSHLSAGTLWGILQPDRRARSRGSLGNSPGVAVVDVTVPGVDGRAIRAGIRVHRSGTLLLPTAAGATGFP
jgi:hypothetical protein